ncbi:MAG: heavy metal translocating P-type ATPase, partial [Verrucomicrobiota bacterium]
AGESFVRETPLTGEPHPVARRPGDTLWAGSYAEDGTLLLAAAAPGSRRRLDTLLEAVDAGRDSLEGTRAQGQADRLAGWFLPVVLLTAVATLVGWGTSGRWADGLFHALSVLLVACPCALGLATPLAWWHGLASLGARGIVIRRAETLERLAAVTRVVFDKTGTLSESGASLVDFVAAGTPAERRRLLGWVQAIQRRCPHPVARAFGRIDPETRPAEPRVEIAALRTVPGAGVEAWVISADGNEHRVQVGRPAWVSPGTGQPGESPDWSAGLRARPGDLVIQVAVDGVVRGMAAVRERLRPSVPEMVRELQGLGVGMAVLTGDRADRAETLVGGWPGLEVAGAQQPADKAARIRGWQRDGQVVAFVGDGINDAPALGQADVGCALQGGADLARAAAGVVLTGDDPAGVVEALRTARRVTASIRGSLVFAAGYNLAGMALAATGRLHPVVAALLMTGSSAAVAWRACRPWPGTCGPEEGQAGTPAGSRGREVLLVAGFLVQWPGLCLLGRLGGWTAAGLGGALALLAAGALRWERAPGRERDGRRVVRMLLWMAGPGNVGMLVGWWMDAGFQAVMQEGVCLCCRSHDYFRAGGGVPWMWLGMLATGLPSMGPWGVGVAGRRSGRVLLAAGAGVGMLGGMWLGGDAVLAWAGPGHPQQFVLAWAGMTVGMLAGMGFAGAVGEALRANLGWRSPGRVRAPATHPPGAARPGGTGAAGVG